jgi:hypothetical protein
LLLGDHHFERGDARGNDRIEGARRIGHARPS